MCIRDRTNGWTRCPEHIAVYPERIAVLIPIDLFRSIRCSLCFCYRITSKGNRPIPDLARRCSRDPKQKTRCSVSFGQLIALQRNRFFDHKTRCGHVMPGARKSYIALLYFLRFCIPLQHPGTFFFSIAIYYLINLSLIHISLSLELLVFDVYFKATQ